MTRPNCPSSCGRKRHHHVSYLPSTTACAGINTFITSGERLSGPTEHQGKISIGMCPCSLISVHITHTHASRSAHEYCYEKKKKKDTHAPRSRAACPLIDRAQPTGSFLCNRLGMDRRPKLFQVSKQDRDGEEMLLSLKCSSTSRQQDESTQMQRTRTNLPSENLNVKGKAVPSSAYIQKPKRSTSWLVCFIEHVTARHTGQLTALRSQGSRVRVLHDKRGGRRPCWCVASFNRCSEVAPTA